MTKQGKIWGLTELIDQNKVFELHRIEFNSGHYCSKHHHQTKYNGFYVISGMLLIRTWTDYSKFDETFLTAGDWLTVKPGVKHQFIAESDGEALEIYWSEFESDDIVRETNGG